MKGIQGRHRDAQQAQRADRLLMGLAVAVWAALTVWLCVRSPARVDDWRALAGIALAVVVVQGVLAGLLRPLSSRTRYSDGMESVHALLSLILGATVSSLVLLLMGGEGLWWWSWWLSSLWPLVLLGLQVMRRRRAWQGASDRHPVIVLGAGFQGEQLVSAMLKDPDASYRPVAFLDDAPQLRGSRLCGVRVEGPLKALHRVALLTGATHAVVAINDRSPELMERVSTLAEAAGVEVLVFPSMSEILDHAPGVEDLRDIDLADLLGRRQIVLDQEAIAGVLSGRTVLVTGAGGSIGSELARQISAFDPERLVLLDRDETGLQAAQVSLEGHGLLQSKNIVLADIRDATRLVEVFKEVRPDVVFHAAALKHLPLLQSHPWEGWFTNVLGTLNVLRASHAAGVGIFVNISTDKAAEPSSVLGYTKRLAERLTADAAATRSGRYVSVRFGNVLGSRGSVIPLFAEQIRRGGPVTITDPRVERYFMLIPEACQLVMQASAIGHSGQVMILEMGRPVRILEVARTMIRLAGRSDVDIHYTGLRPGEKLSEVLVSPGEHLMPSAHPLLSAIDVPPLSPSALRELTPDPQDLTRAARAWAMGHADVEADPAPAEAVQPRV